MDPMIEHFESLPTRRWQARWIWHERPEKVRFVPRGAGTERWVGFRRRLPLDHIPSFAPTRVFADGRFVVWVNGREVLRGPFRAPPGAARYSVADLAPFLVSGPNVVAVLVHHPGAALPWWTPSPASGELGRGALAMEIRLGSEVIGTDQTWLCSAALGRDSHQPGEIRGLPVETFEADALSTDWTRVEFDDRGWSPAVELDSATPHDPEEQQPPSMPYGPLLPPPWQGVVSRRRKLLLRPDSTAKVVDVSGALSLVSAVDMGVVDGPTEVFFCDLEEVTCGTVEIGGTADEEFRFALVAGELPDGSDLGGDVLASGVGTAGPFRIETIHPRGFRRLAMIVTPPGRIRLASASVTERFSKPRRVASFECSDPDLTAIWRAGRRTVDLCSLDTYVDCPTREQRAWSVDPVVATMVDLATSDRWDLPRWSLELRSTLRPDGMLPMVVVADLEGPVYIPLVVCHQMRAFRELWWYTGDRELVGDLLGTYRRALRWFADLQRDDGLLWDVPGWMFVDWTAVETRGASSVVNGLWGRALLDLSELARAIGDSAVTRWAEERHRTLQEGFEAFWDRNRSRYRDHLGESVQASQYGQAAAIVGGLVPAERAEQVVATMLDRRSLVDACWEMPPGTAPTGTNVVPLGSIWKPHPEPWWDVERELVAAQPFFRYVVHDAAVAAGNAQAVPDLCRDWAPMLRRGGGTLSETWTTGTTCHAWSATPTRDLVTTTLGVRPATPGFGEVTVAPNLGDLDWASATLPHPQGEIRVAIGRDRIEVTSPVPVRIDPRSLWDGAVVRLDAGRHLLTP